LDWLRLLNWVNCLRLRVELLGRLPWWLWLLKLLHCDWTWLIIHKLWLPEVQAKLVWHWGGDNHYCLLLLNSSNILLRFRAPFGTVTSFMILAVEVWISWVVICEFRGCSFPSPSIPLGANPPLALGLLFWFV
jgi:hypothetical protein